MLKFISRKLIRKFAFVGALGFLAVIVPVVPLIGNYNEQISFADKERDGIAIHRELRAVLQDLQRHRGASTSFLGGKEDFKSRMESAQTGADAALKKVDAAFEAHGNGISGLSDWAGIKKDWGTLKAGLLSSKPQENAKTHTALISRVLDLMGVVCDSSNLTLDPDLASYYAMDLTMVQIPGITEQMGRGRAGGSLALTETALSPDRRDALIAIAVESNFRSKNIQSDAGKLFGADDQAKQKLSTLYAEATQGVTKFISNMNDNILRPSILTYPASQYFDETTKAIDASYTLYDEGATVLDTLIDQRISGLKTSRLSVLAAILLVSLLAAGIAIMILRRIGTSILIATGALKEIAAGHLDSEVHSGSDDEVGQLIEDLDSMRGQLRDRIAKDRKIADATLRIKIALDSAAMPMTIADENNNFIYMNGASLKLWHDMASDIRRLHPSFTTVEAMIGKNPSEYYDDEAMRTAARSRLTSAKQFDVRLGGRMLRVNTAPVTNEQGEYLGHATQWADRTLEIQIEKEVANLVAGASRGEFDTRLSLEGKEGFFRQVADGLNKLSVVTQAGLSDVAVVMKQVADGDLTKTIDGDYQGLFGVLKDSTNSTIQHLQEVVGRIQEATGAINIAAKEIAAGNQDLSSRTEQQASSLEETASSMEELNSTVKQNADNARQANNLAQNCNDVATQAGKMVTGIVSTMGVIKASSSKIADIIGVIDSIAFQTNILALNAAIEAARAGEQGRGFAVVAKEVRSLAQRSATAAKEIKELIAESVSKVEDGAHLVESAGTTMENVVSSIHLVAARITEITEASHEQSRGIEQVATAVSQMDEVTQQNAALVEEASAAAESLEDQARGLVSTVAMFKLPNQQGQGRSMLSPALRKVSTPRLSHAKGKGQSAAKLPAPHIKIHEGEWSEF